MKNWAISLRLRLIFLPCSCSSLVFFGSGCGPVSLYSNEPSSKVCLLYCAKKMSPAGSVPAKSHT